MREGHNREAPPGGARRRALNRHNAVSRRTWATPGNGAPGPYNKALSLNAEKRNGVNSE